jgi:hypothetical protein
MSTAAAAAIDPFVYAGPPPFVIFSGVEAAAAMPPPLAPVPVSADSLGRALTAALTAEGMATMWITAAAFAALVQQAVAVVRTGLPPALAAYETQVQERVAVAAAWNHQSRAVAVLGSSGLGWGVHVLPYLRPSVEGRAMHATSQAIRVAVRRTRWPHEVRQWCHVVGGGGGGGVHMGGYL